MRAVDGDWIREVRGIVIHPYFGGGASGPISSCRSPLSPPPFVLPSRATATTAAPFASCRCSTIASSATSASCAAASRKSPAGRPTDRIRDRRRCSRAASRAALRILRDAFRVAASVRPARRPNRTGDLTGIDDVETGLSTRNVRRISIGLPALLRPSHVGNTGFHEPHGPTADGDGSTTPASPCSRRGRSPLGSASGSRPSGRATTQAAE